MTASEKNHDEIVTTTRKLLQKNKKTSAIYDKLQEENLLGRMSKQQFHGKFVLPLARELKGGKKVTKSEEVTTAPVAKRGRPAKAQATTTTNGNGQREQIRGVLVDLVERAVGIPSNEAVRLVGKGLDPYIEKLMTA